jgi:hypothetical protein
LPRFNSAFGLRFDANLQLPATACNFDVRGARENPANRDTPQPREQSRRHAPESCPRSRSWRISRCEIPTLAIFQAAPDFQMSKNVVPHFVNIPYLDGMRKLLLSG